MKNKKNIIMIIVICLLGVGIGYLLFNSSDNGLVELNYNELTTKIENKEDFVVCISRTTCSHCNDYKPKLRKVANKYKLIFTILILISIIKLTWKNLIS